MLGTTCVGTESCFYFFFFWKGKGGGGGGGWGRNSLIHASMCYYLLALSLSSALFFKESASLPF